MVLSCVASMLFYQLMFILIVLFRYDESTLKQLSSNKQSAVTEEQGQRMASIIGASQYLECSARTKEGVRAVFEAATLVAIAKNDEVQPSCWEKCACL